VPRNVRRSINGMTDPDAVPFERAILLQLPARHGRTSVEASGAGVSSGEAIMKHGGLPGGAESAGRDQQPRRRVSARATAPAEVGQADPARSKVPDEGRKVREMGGWDLCGGCQMLQAVHGKSPCHMTPEDFSDPGLLGAREHGGRYRSRTAPREPGAGTFSTAV
jgi:hypothetical protein